MSDVHVEVEFVTDRVVAFTKDVPQGTYRQTVTWESPPTDRELASAVALIRDAKAADLAADSGHVVRTFSCGPVTVYLHHDWGPPAWVWPRVKVGWSDGLTLGVGWRLHAFAVHLGRSKADG